MRISTNRHALASAVFLLVALAGAPASVLADGDQSAAADRPIAVVGTMEGQLEPGPRAPFAYYRFVYPGGGRVVSVNLQVEPDLPTVLQNAGFRVYGPRAGWVYATSGVQPGLTPNVSGDMLGDETGEYLIQVYDVDVLTPIDFVIWGTGMPQRAVESTASSTDPSLPAPAPPGN